MQVQYKEITPVVQEDDIAAVRMLVKSKAKELGFSLTNQTKIMTAASELARNIIKYGLGGRVVVEVIEDYNRTGLRMEFQDEGPGIEDIDQAMVDGFTSGNGLGLGLSGSKRLMDEFEIVSAPRQGTCVSITKWTQ